MPALLGPALDVQGAMHYHCRQHDRAPRGPAGGQGGGRAAPAQRRRPPAPPQRRCRARPRQRQPRAQRGWGRRPGGWRPDAASCAAARPPQRQGVRGRRARARDRHPGAAALAPRPAGPARPRTPARAEPGGSRRPVQVHGDAHEHIGGGALACSQMRAEPREAKLGCPINGRAMVHGTRHSQGPLYGQTGGRGHIHSSRQALHAVRLPRDRAAPRPGSTCSGGA